MIDEEHRPTALPCGDGAHEAGSARPDDDDVEGFHQALLAQCPGEYGGAMGASVAGVFLSAVIIMMVVTVALLLPSIGTSVTRAPNSLCLVLIATAMTLDTCFVVADPLFEMFVMLEGRRSPGLGGVALAATALNPTMQVAAGICVACDTLSSDRYF